MVEVMSKSSGQIVEQTTHIFDLVRYLLGDVKSIYAVANIGLTTDVPNYDVRDASVVSLVFKSGVVANITSSCIVEAGGGVRLDMGEQGFREMVLAAKEAGYRITPNMNALGLDYALPEFRRMWRHQVADREGNKLGWPGTFPGAATHAFAYMRPCARAWREHLVKKIVEFITEYDLDAAYLVS
ncbi:MAG TPA: hypothetical protein EYP17_10270 [Candidatus Latescibacteria bacterium]|nr:hypothetical protein [Candidatus Latescibacterota bacterium]